MNKDVSTNKLVGNKGNMLNVLGALFLMKISAMCSAEDNIIFETIRRYIAVEHIIWLDGPGSKCSPCSESSKQAAGSKVWTNPCKNPK